MCQFTSMTVLSARTTPGESFCRPQRDIYGIFYVNITLDVLGEIALVIIEILGYTVVFSETPQMFEFAFMAARPLFMGAQLPLAPT